MTLDTSDERCERTDALATDSTVVLGEKASLASREVHAIQPECVVQQAKPISAAPPNGGLLAWLQVGGAFFVYFNTWGIINMYGVYQTFYQSDLLSSESASNISWVGSIQSFLILALGPIVGSIYDAGYLYALLYVGAFLSIFGMMMTSICTAYWQILLTQGIVTGVGFGCLFVVALASISQFFSTRKAIATGIASTGSSIAGVIYPVVFAQLQPRIGFGWATRTVAFIMLGTSAVFLFGIRQRLPPSTRREIFDVKALRDLPFLMYCVALLFGFMGVYVAFFYVQIYALTECHTSAAFAFWLLPIINLTSTFGRLLPSYLADKIGPLNIQIPFTLITALLSFAWIAISTTPSLVVFCVLYGCFCGSFLSLPGPTVVSLSPNLGVIGTRIGMAGAFAGIGLLIGSPIAGAILRGQSGWLGVKIWCGILLSLSGFCMICARLLKAGPRLQVKV